MLTPDPPPPTHLPTYLPARLLRGLYFWELTALLVLLALLEFYMVHLVNYADR